jgi:AraC family transcriptional regulator
VAAPATSRLLLDAGDLQVGEFRCVPTHPLWHEINDNIGPRPHVVFPHTSVYIDRLGGEPVLATPNHVLFYSSHERYRRALHDPRGDRCVFVMVAPRLWEQLNEGRPPAGQGPSDPETYLLQHLVVRHMREESKPDRLFVDEALHHLVRRAIGRARPEAGHAARAGTRRAHRELAEAAKAILADRVAESVSLVEVAAAVHASPFHLSRVFHDVTGFSLHGYRIHLRLRRSLEHLEAGTDLTRLAYELGFCSLAHFSDSFRRVFGTPPSAVRGTGELRKIVEARLAPAS